MRTRSVWSSGLAHRHPRSRLRRCHHGRLPRQSRASCAGARPRSVKGGRGGGRALASDRADGRCAARRRRCRRAGQRAGWPSTARSTGSTWSLVCVGTPSRADGQLDLSHLLAAPRQLGRALRPAPRRPAAAAGVSQYGAARDDRTGSCCRRWRRRAGEGPGRPLRGRLQPEFLREATAVKDYFAPPKIVVGEREPGVSGRLRGMYEGIEAPLSRCRSRRRDRQVRRQLLARAKGRIRQRGRPGCTRPRRRPAGRGRHLPGRHQAECVPDLSAPGRPVRRFVPAQGPVGDAGAGPRRRPVAPLLAGPGEQRGPPRLDRQEVRPRLARRRGRSFWWASRSRPAPTTCATAPSWTWPSSCSRRATSSRPRPRPRSGGRPLRAYSISIRPDHGRPRRRRRRGAADRARQGDPRRAPAAARGQPRYSTSRAFRASPDRPQ